MSRFPARTMFIVPLVALFGSALPIPAYKGTAAETSVGNADDVDSPTNALTSRTNGFRTKGFRIKGFRTNGFRTDGFKSKGFAQKGLEVKGLVENGSEQNKAGKRAYVPLAGHSEHGDAYNDGPRQDAYLMGGTGQVDLQVTTSNEQSQAFFDQGLGQLYGFWYYEAERSFRRVVALDPNCAMGYWGLAQANIENKQRGAEFIREAHKKKAQVGEHEQMYIDALYAYLTQEAEEKQLRSGYVKDLERIIRKYPHDVEAKAMLAVHLWQSSQHGLPIVSHQAVDSLLEDIFRKVKNHPAHHFRIHLWDQEEPSQALASAALCGQAAPTIAHMWHMPGHIFSRLHRFHDAIFQQEASARADHAHMMRDGVLPDQIHNYAHNNEWLIRNLIHVGRTADAMSLARNMLELPQHPKYNAYSKAGMCSCKYGRSRLLQIHETFELWDALVETGQSVYLPATEVPELQTPRLRSLGVAHHRRGETAQLALCIQRLEAIAAATSNDAQKAGCEAEQKIREESIATQAADDTDVRSEPRQLSPAAISKKIKKARQDVVDRASKGIDDIARAVAELRGLQWLARGETDQAIEQFAKTDCHKARLAEYYFLCGDHEKAVQLLEQAVESGENEVYPLAKQVDLLRRMGRAAAAQTAFEKLRLVAGKADLNTPLLTRLEKFAAKLEYPTDWRISPATRIDVGDRPDLDTLGPLQWAPSPAMPWSLPGTDGAMLSLSDFRGRPVVVIFYLGAGCLHCVEQLHEFAPLHDEFELAGISLVAISTESGQQLESSLTDYSAAGHFPISLVANEDLSVFKAYRAYDDFENMPLHGTFLIDEQGLIRWCDISYEPFLKADYLLQECQRLLATKTKQQSND